MLISQLVNPAILTKLDPSDHQLLNTIVMSEVIASPKIRAELTKKVNAGVKALRARSVVPKKTNKNK